MLDCESLMSACDRIFCVKYGYCIMRHFNISTLYRRIKCLYAYCMFKSVKFISAKRER